MKLFVDLIKFEIVHVWMYTCTWRVLTEPNSGSAFERLNIKLLRETYISDCF